MEFMDVETRSRWDMLGYAVSGPLGGVRLEQLPAYNSMWFAWNTYWPETTIWETGDGIIEAPPMTAVLEPAGASLPDGFELTQNYPNPFNPETWIPFRLAESSEVVITIYDVAGRRVMQCDMGRLDAGSYATRDKAAYWDGRNAGGEGAGSGMYLYRLDAGAVSATRRMVRRK